MREYLFRGKRLDNGEWVEGGSIFKLINKIGEHFFIPQLGKGLIANHDDNMMNIVALEDMVMYRVDPETVGQYTGLKDDNGTRVYEGDIIERRSSRRNYRDAVVAEEWNCGCCSDVYGFSTYEGVVHLRDNFVVIGNIHDNPELLRRGGEE